MDPARLEEIVLMAKIEGAGIAFRESLRLLVALDRDTDEADIERAARFAVVCGEKFALHVVPAQDPDRLGWVRKSRESQG